MARRESSRRRRRRRAVIRNRIILAVLIVILIALCGTLVYVLMNGKEMGKVRRKMRWKIRPVRALGQMDRCRPRIRPRLQNPPQRVRAAIRLWKSCLIHLRLRRIGGSRMWLPRGMQCWMRPMSWLPCMIMTEPLNCFRDNRIMQPHQEYCGCRDRI